MTRLSVRGIVEKPTGAGAGSCCVVVRLRTADGALTRLSVDEYGGKCLLELARVAVVWECFGPLMMEH